MRIISEYAHKLAAPALAMAAWCASRGVPIHCGLMWGRPLPAPLRTRQSR